MVAQGWQGLGLTRLLKTKLRQNIWQAKTFSLQARVRNWEHNVDRSSSPSRGILVWTNFLKCKLYCCFCHALKFLTGLCYPHGHCFYSKRRFGYNMLSIKGTSELWINWLLTIYHGVHITYFIWPNKDLVTLWLYICCGMAQESRQTLPYIFVWSSYSSKYRQEERRNSNHCLTVVVAPSSFDWLIEKYRS